MQVFSADMHVHTVLSPCGDLEMSPVNVVEAAALKQIDILGITDHNSTRHGPLIKKLAAKHGIFVLCGAEVTTREEAHCLAFFENDEALNDFQDYLDEHLPDIKNDPRYFGCQVVVNEKDEILEEVDRLLISALDQSLSQIEEKVHALNGLFIPAHIDRPSLSLISQLGFVPPDLKADAFEISGKMDRSEIIRRYPYLKDATFICSSDAHYPDQIGRRTTKMSLEKRSFKEIAMALHGDQGRSVKCVMQHINPETGK